MVEETSFTSFDSLAMPARQWSTASARSPPELARSPIFDISSCMAVTRDSEQHCIVTRGFLRTHRQLPAGNA